MRLKYFMPICICTLIFSIMYSVPGWGEDPGQLYPRISINGEFDTVRLGESGFATLEVSLNKNGVDGNADYWVAVATSSGILFCSPSGWTKDATPLFQGSLMDMENLTALAFNVVDVPTGTYEFYFGIDTIMDGKLAMDNFYFDTVIMERFDSRLHPVEISIESMGTKIIFQSNGEMTKVDAENLCEENGYRLPSIDEMKALAALFMEGGKLDDILIHEQYWAFENFEEENSYFCRPATNFIDYSDKLINRYGVLFMEADIPINLNDSGFISDVIGNAVKLGADFTGVAGVKILAGPLVSFALGFLDPDETANQLKEIEAKLDKVSGQLTDLAAQLKESSQELQNMVSDLNNTIISEASLTLESINYPTESIEDIQNWLFSFRDAALDNDTKKWPLLEDQILNDKTGILGTLRNIYGRIVPNPSTGKVGILSNYEKYLEYSGKGFKESYEPFEDYFTNLYTFQQLGLTLYLYYKDPEAPSRQINLDEFNDRMIAQAGKKGPGSGNQTYTHNAFRLVMKHLKPNEADTDDLYSYPSEPKINIGMKYAGGSDAALKKTEFIRRNMANQNQNGLFGAIILTKDMYPDEEKFNSSATIFNISATNTATGELYKHTEMESCIMNGPVYDYRYSSSDSQALFANLKPDDKYKVITFGFEDVPEGSYEVEVEFLPPTFLYGQVENISKDSSYKVNKSVKVMGYSNDYETEPEDGKLSVKYGYALMCFRLKDRYLKNSALYTKESFTYKRVHEIGDINQLPFGLKSDGVYYHCAVGDGARELRAPFFYTGKADEKLHIDIGLQVRLQAGTIDKIYDGMSYGYIDKNAPNPQAYFIIGVYDKTAGARVTNLEVKTELALKEDKYTFWVHKWSGLANNYEINETLSFKPQKDHQYYIYLSDKLKNSVDDTRSTIEKIDSINFRFDR